MKIYLAISIFSAAVALGLGFYNFLFFQADEIEILERLPSQDDQLDVEKTRNTVQIAMVSVTVFEVWLIDKRTSSRVQIIGGVNMPDDIKLRWIGRRQLEICFYKDSYIGIIIKNYNDVNIDIIECSN